MKNRASIHFLCLLIAWSFLAPGAFAQDMPARLAEMWLIEPKAGHGEEFAAGVREHMAYRQEQGDPRAWQAYRPLLGDGLGRLAVRYCCINWADVDAYREWEAGHPAVQAHFDEHVAPHVAGAEHYFESMDWANSHWSDARGPSYRLFAVTEFHVEPEDVGDFDETRVKMSQIALEKGWGDDNDWLWAATIGGPPVQAIIIPHRNFASLDGGERSFLQFLTEQMGSAEAAADLMHDFLSATRNSSYQIWEHQPELSMPEDEG